MVHKKSKKAFTLVELIVVITILAILGTIGFISVQGYSLSARTSARTSDLATLSKGFDVILAAGKVLPQPNVPMVTFSASGTIIGYQGCAGAGVLSSLSISKMQDPLDGACYTYSTNVTQNKYQILVLQEAGSNIAVGSRLIDTAYAGPYDTRIPFTRGNQLGILVGTGANLNRPVQEMSFTWMDLAKTTTGSGYVMVFGNSDTTAFIPSTGTGAYTGSLFTFAFNRRSELALDKNLALLDPSLVGYWDMETTMLSGAVNVLKDLSKYGNNATCYNAAAAVSCGSGQWPQFVTGKTGKAMRFDGVDDFVDISNMSGFNEIEWTVLVRFSLNQLPKDIGKHQVLWSNWLDNNNRLYFFTHALSNRLTLYWTNGGTISANMETDIGAKTATSYLAAFGYAGGQAYTYLNWSKLWVTVGTNSYGSAHLNTGKIGYAPGAGLTYFDGTIDEVRIYNRALSDAEISSFYDATN